MTYRTANAQTQHDQIVLVVVNHVAQNGYGNIRAGLPGHSQPALAQGTKQDHIPDVTADGVTIEVETSGTIDDDHTTSQSSLFANYAPKSCKTFWVAVPNGSVAAAQRPLNTLRLTGVVYGV
jgi:hypothetical protein